MTGDNAKHRETVTAPRLEWQRELDATMDAIDSRLTHPRRRATDAAPQQTLPGLAEANLSTEMLDEIAWRVAEQMRRHALAFPAPQPDGRPAGIVTPVTQVPLQPGKMLLIRYRMPRLPWPFRLLQRRRRRKQHPLTTVKASA
jgi:hypothetical protein